MPPASMMKIAKLTRLHQLLLALNSADEYIELREDRGLLPWQLAREEMLSSRLGGLALARTRISEDGSVAGLGLFATRAIKAGELITCYPGDALVCLNNEEQGGVNEFVYVCVCVCVYVYLNSRVQDDSAHFDSYVYYDEMS